VAVKVSPAGVLSRRRPGRRNTLCRRVGRRPQRPAHAL